MEDINPKEIMVGTVEGFMIVEGTVYCDTCWDIRPDLVSGCPCSKEKKRCDSCPASGPCAICYPERQAAWSVYMQAFDAVLGSFKEPEYEEAEEKEIAEEKYGSLSCENCFLSYKTYNTERTPCSYCNVAYREDWNRAVLMSVESEALAMERYGTLNCTACNTFYSSQSPLVCSECHPQYIEDCRRGDEEDYYESLERRYAAIY
jgi:hypothetical protein